MTREAIAEVTAFIDRKGWCPFVMERTQSHIVAASSRKVDVIAYHFNDISGVFNFLDGSFVNHYLKIVEFSLIPFSSSSGDVMYSEPSNFRIFSSVLILVGTNGSRNSFLIRPNACSVHFTPAGFPSTNNRLNNSLNHQCIGRAS